MTPAYEAKLARIAKLSRQIHEELAGEDERSVLVVYGEENLNVSGSNIDQAGALRAAARFIERDKS